MGEIINLNKARKAREKAVKEQKAGENRANTVRRSLRKSLCLQLLRSFAVRSMVQSWMVRMNRLAHQSATSENTVHILSLSDSFI